MQNSTPGIYRPHVTHVVSQTVKKGEVKSNYFLIQGSSDLTTGLCVGHGVQDVTMVHMSPYQADSGLGYNLAVFAVADGHNGCAAALHCQESLYRELMLHMPAMPPPAPGTSGTVTSCIFIAAAVDGTCAAITSSPMLVH